jgi:hypothetical protein
MGGPTPMRAGAPQSATSGTLSVGNHVEIGVLSATTIGCKMLFEIHTSLHQSAVYSNTLDLSVLLFGQTRSLTTAFAGRRSKIRKQTGCDPKMRTDIRQFVDQAFGSRRGPDVCRAIGERP